MGLSVPSIDIPGVPEVADWFLIFDDGTVDWIPAPRINVPAWIKFWRVMTSNPEKPGYTAAVSTALESAMVITGVALDTLSALLPKLDAVRQKQAETLREEVIAVRAKLVPLIDVMLKTADPSALNAGVVAPLLHGAKSIMFEAATLANQVEQLAPTVHWEWGGVFEGETTLAPDEWNIMSGLGRKLSEMLIEFDKSAPGEAPTLRDRVEKAGKTALASVKKKASQASMLLLVVAVIFLGGALWQSGR